MLEKIQEKMIKELAANGQALSMYAQGIELLQRSGVLEILKLAYRPKIILHGNSQQESMALSGAYSAGALDSLEVLVNFKELYMEQERGVSVPRMDFNGIEYAIQKGTLTKEEADAIRNGRKPDYKQFTTAKPVNGGSAPADAGIKKSL
jgi:hypothetical protein